MGLTQEQLANEFGIKRNTVTRYESGLLAIPRYIELALKTIVLMYSEEISSVKKEITTAKTTLPPTKKKARSKKLNKRVNKKGRRNE